MLLELSASGNTPDQAVDTARELGRRLNVILHDAQVINGADDSYLYSALLIDGPGQASEIFTSRLRTLIIVGVAGGLLIFGSVSVARSMELIRTRRPGVEKSAKHVNKNEAGITQLPGARSGREAGLASEAGGVESVDPPDGESDPDFSRVTVPDRETRPNS